MAYYRGDYYSGRVQRQRNPFSQRRVKSVGDYYYGRGRGDPFWGALFKGIGKVAKNLLIGPAAPPSAGGGPSARDIAMNIAGFLPAGPGGMTTFPGGPGSMQRPPTLPSNRIQIPPSGQIVNRLPDINLPAERGGGFRRRRMNPANSKALNRSIRRVIGFGKLAARAKRSVSKAATQLGCYRRGSTVRRKR